MFNMTKKISVQMALASTLALCLFACSDKNTKDDIPITEAEVQTEEGASTVNETPAVAVEIEVLNRPDNVYENVEVMSPIYFAYESTKLDDIDKAVLDGFYKAMQAADPGVVTLVGHTDEPGGDEFNKKLGMDRAQAVKDYLVSLGAKAENFNVESNGENNLVVDTKGAQRHWKNRRVEFTVAVKTTTP